MLMKLAMTNDGGLRDIFPGNRKIDLKILEGSTLNSRDSFSNLYFLILLLLGISWPMRINSNYDSLLWKIDHEHIVHLSWSIIIYFLGKNASTILTCLSLQAWANELCGLSLTPTPDRLLSWPLEMMYATHVQLCTRKKTFFEVFVCIADWQLHIIWKDHLYTWHVTMC